MSTLDEGQKVSYDAVSERGKLAAANLRAVEANPFFEASISGLAATCRAFCANVRSLAISSRSNACAIPRSCRLSDKIKICR
jgi:hypothetical protein